jgi:hypothetical protein
MLNYAVNCGNRYYLLKDNKYKDEDINDKFIDEYISWCEFSNKLCKRMTSKGVSKEDYKEAKDMCRIISKALENAKSLKDLKKLSFKFKTKFDFNKEYNLEIYNDLLREAELCKDKKLKEKLIKAAHKFYKEYIDPKFYKFKSRVRKSVRKSRVRKSVRKSRVRKSIRKINKRI